MRVAWPIATVVAAVCFLGAFVQAECPNGCSGNGDCMAKDMCECYKNYQGNDCGDRTCLFGRAHVDTPKGDINMDKSTKSTGLILSNSQQHPAGTWEYFPDSSDAANEEAHFYMECSNKGICDRSTGLCQCFDGYEGNGCQRTTCPGKCNGHGTCESIRELGLKEAGTLFGREGASGPVKYDLWDSNSTYGCRCDPWYFGPDCNRRTCKVGVDPLYLSAGSPTYETFVVHAYVAEGASVTGTWFRLRLFDYYGESYITKKITILADSDTTDADSDLVADVLVANAKTVADAINAVPNQTFRKVKCESTGVGTDLAGFKSKRPLDTQTPTPAPLPGFSITCQFVDNPGKIRIPEVVSSSSGTTVKLAALSQQGQDDDWFTVKSTNLVSSIDVGATGKVVTLTAAYTSADAFTNQLVKIGPHIVLMGTPTSTTVVNLVFPLKHTIGTTPPVFLPPSTTMITVTAGDAITVATSVGDDFLTFGAAAPAVLSVGDLIFYHNAFFSIQQIWLDTTITKYKAKLDKPFGGDVAGEAGATTSPPYKVVLNDKSQVYNYVSECSGRGMCNYETGICACFKGYTNDNCNTQNILAV